MTSKERSRLMSLAQTLDPVVQVGRAGLTPEIVISADEALAKRELIKINIQKNCLEDHKELAHTLAERTHSQLVQIIGSKVVLYRPAQNIKDRKILFS
ncbi:MAG: ribosome assembly RNA-binding protein YhbY [Lachnospiraceae bacterium]|nr:ribosome assembly RNA-binding protein YhbY [Lachnospiraceae bacterium]